MIIQTKSYPRAALIGNPSDGYYGKTIAFVFSNFSAEVKLYESPRLEIVANKRDIPVFDSINHLVSTVKKYGYYGGFRLLRATIKRFYDYCREKDIQLDERNFTVEYNSTIPMGLGLAGSSAIITACMRALMQFFNIKIPKPILANLVLSVEVDELDIPAGLQDRVAQAYETPVFMDFSKDIMDKQGYGEYTTLDPTFLPKMYVAFRTELSEGTEVTHSNLRAQYNLGVEKVLKAIKRWSALSTEVKNLLEQGKSDKVGGLLNENFDLRRQVTNISQGNIKMINIARSVGASAKFTGSGGAIIGTYEDEVVYDVLKIKLKAENIEILKPKIVSEMNS